VSVLGLSLLAVLLWGMAPLFEKSALARTTPLVALTIRSLVMAAAYVGAAVAMGTGGELLRVDGRSLGYIILSAIIGGVAGLFVYFHALKLGDAAVVVPITATYPLATALFAVLFLGEPLTPSRILGALLIVAGVYFVR